MPHACTGCDRSFPDGSTEMLSGCPSCGGNRFQFIPAGSSAPPDEQRDDQLIEADEEPIEPPAPTPEDPAQAAARSSFVGRDELPATPSPQEEQSIEPDASQSANEGPADLGELKAELEDSFESIKIVDRGEYELNLMELYERPECIIELGENGRYAIHVPETLSSSDR